MSLFADSWVKSSNDIANGRNLDIESSPGHLHELSEESQRHLLFDAIRCKYLLAIVNYHILFDYTLMIHLCI